MSVACETPERLMALENWSEACINMLSSAFRLGVASGADPETSVPSKDVPAWNFETLSTNLNMVAGT